MILIHHIFPQGSNTSLWLEELPDMGSYTAFYLKINYKKAKIISKIAMKTFYTALFFIFLTGSVFPDTSERYIITTIHPASVILEELAKNRLKVVRLVRPGISPHSYEPLPSDMVKLAKSAGIFYISHDLDGWVLKEKNRQSFEILANLPENMRLNMEDDHGHDHELDPHFWMDPLAVKAILPGLTGALCSIDPEGCRQFVANAKTFDKKLIQIDEKIKKILENSRGKKFFLYHASFRYFFKRYGLTEAGILEPVSGGEPTPRHIADLIGKAKKHKISAILLESLYSPVSSRMLSEQTGLPVKIIDSTGGADGRISYEELLLFNTKVIAESSR